VTDAAGGTRIRRAVRLALGLAVSAVCATLALRGVDWQRFVGTITHVNPWWLAGAILANLSAVAVGGLRWRVVVRPNADLTVRDAVQIYFIGNFANTVVSRLGDIARVVLTGRRSRTAAGRILGGMVVERSADVLMLLLLAFVLSWLVTLPSIVRAGIVVVGTVTVAVVGTMWAAAGRLVPIVRRVAAFFSGRLATAIGDLVHAFSAGLRSSATQGSLVLTLVLSVANWTLSGLALFAMTRAFGLRVPWFAGPFVMLVLNLGSVIPTSPGALGVYHYLTVLALSLWVADPTAPLGFAVVNHALGLVMTAVLGGIGLLGQGVSFRAVSGADWASAVAEPTVGS